MNLFAKLISPLEERDFFANWHQKRFKVISGRKKDFFTPFLALSDIDKLLEMGLKYPDLKVAKDGKVADLSSFYLGSKATNSFEDKAFQAYYDGFTLIINRLQERLPKLKALSLDLGSLLNCKVNCNLYVTPPGESKGFSSHFDSHEIVILQIAGKKKWNIYKKGKIPDNPTGRFADRSGFRGEVYVSDPELDKEIVLSEGDTMYLPIGVPHDAQTVSDEPSIHVTISLIPHFGFEFFNFLSLEAENDLFFRNIIPGNFNKQQDFKTYEKEIKLKMKDLIDQVDFSKLIELQRVNEKRQLSKNNIDRFAQSMYVGKLNMQDQLFIRPNIEFEIFKRGFAVKLLFNQSTIEFPIPALDFVKEITSQEGKFTLADVKTQLSEDLVILYTKKLVTTGFLGMHR